MHAPAEIKGLKRYAGIAASVLTFFLLLYVLVEALDVGALTDPSAALNRPGVGSAAVGVGLLVADAVLPVPSSLVMLAHGALFGVLVGALLSIVGRLGSALAGFWIGRKGGRYMARLVSDDERERANALLARWGALAVLITRPVPLLAETVTVLAGASRMRWATLALAATLGSLPEAVLYAVAGSVAARFHNAALVFLAMVVVASAFWLVLSRAGARLEADVARNA